MPFSCYVFLHSSCIGGYLISLEFPPQIRERADRSLSCFHTILLSNEEKKVECRLLDSVVLVQSIHFTVLSSINCSPRGNHLKGGQPLTQGFRSVGCVLLYSQCSRDISIISAQVKAALAVLTSQKVHSTLRAIYVQTPWHNGSYGWWVGVHVCNTSLLSYRFLGASALCYYFPYLF